MDCYEVQSSDQEGWRYNHIAYVSTETVAKQVVTHLNKTRKWPHRYINISQRFKIYDSLEELNESMATIRP